MTVARLVVFLESAEVVLEDGNAKIPSEGGGETAIASVAAREKIWCGDGTILFSGDVSDRCLGHWRIDLEGC